MSDLLLIFVLGQLEVFHIVFYFIRESLANLGLLLTKLSSYILVYLFDEGSLLLSASSREIDLTLATSSL